MHNKQNVNDWLEYIESAHTQAIDMGLDRVLKVFKRLSIDFSSRCVVTVAGTNGKGTTCRFVEQACLKAHLKVGVYSSPHIMLFNERIRVAGVDVSDTALCTAFNKIYDAAKGSNSKSRSADNANNRETHHNTEQSQDEISLSYFEYATLCALVIFAQSEVDVCVLEVGLGGRLDATNIIDANIGVITSIGLDHQSFLGNTLEEIAGEKAGIIKSATQVVIGYSNMQHSVANILTQFSNRTLLCDRDFGLLKPDTHAHGLQTQAGWIKINGSAYRFSLKNTQIPPQNVMTAIATLHLIAKHFAHENIFLLEQSSLTNLIDSVNIAGRFEEICKVPLIILDVAHNEDSAKYLCTRLQQKNVKRCHIIIGMLKDKNIEATIDQLAPLNAKWYCVDMPTQRGEKALRLQQAARKHQQEADTFTTVAQALRHAKQRCQDGDAIVVVGSFIMAANFKQALLDDKR